MVTLGQSNADHETEGVISASPENLSAYSISGSEEYPSPEESDNSDSEEEDQEPALKYERLNTVTELLKNTKDTASVLVVSGQTIVLGTHSGVVHILDIQGARLKSFKPHQASVVDISVDVTADFVATASIDGLVVIHSLSTPESYQFDMKRSMRTVALEPQFATRSSRAFVCGGMAGELVLREKGWLGHKDTILHAGEGPIWLVRWRDRLIAWANDLGIKIYDTLSQTRITYIDRPPDSPRAELYKCSLYWQDDTTLLIAWADRITVARIHARPRTTTTTTVGSLPPLLVEITAVFELDCMISGLVPHSSFGSESTSLMIMAYNPPDKALINDSEEAEDRAQQARKAAERPELRIISRAGEEMTADAISFTDFHLWGCNDYSLVEILGSDEACYIAMSPKDLIIARARDRRDHIEWLLEKKLYAEALDEADKLREIDPVNASKIDTVEIGQKYLEHLIHEGEFLKAAQLCPKACRQDVVKWESWIWVFAQKRKLQIITPYLPTAQPRLGHLVYEMVLGQLLVNDRQALLRMIKEWPTDIYDLSAIIFAVQAELSRSASSSSGIMTSESVILMECLAELYTANRQPGKALPFFLRLRRPNVFDLIRDHNLFTDVQDQVLLLVEFDRELSDRKKMEHGSLPDGQYSDAIKLLVDHVHSIPVARVISQLQSSPQYLFMYLDALTSKDPHLTADHADQQVKLCAEFATTRLIDFLRSSSNYNLEQAYQVCKDLNLVSEMVFLLGRMGDNKKALTLIIESLGDVNRAIDFAKEQSDDDLWEDLLKYSETRPAFIRGLLENVGAEIDPKRVIRRIKNGLEIPGLKDALIKILQDFHLQISLLEGCQTILQGDSLALSRRLQKDQSGGFVLTGKLICLVCGLHIQAVPQSVIMLFLCRHVVHAHCTEGGDDLPEQPDPLLMNVGALSGRAMSSKIAFASDIRVKVEQGCPICYSRNEGSAL